MVSFFGLKLGGDRKKTQVKAQPKAPVGAQIEAQTSISQKWSRHRQNTISEGQNFIQNLPQPEFPSPNMRPGTANSIRSSTNWRTVFKNRSTTSSLVEPAPPGRRQKSISGLRCAVSEMNLRSRSVSSAALGRGGHQPDTPTRPGTSNKAEWVNPLNAHSCKEFPGNGSATALAVSPTHHVSKETASLGKFSGNPSLGSSDWSEGGRDANHHGLPNENHVFRHGYPSPPQSDKNSDIALSPVNAAASDGGVFANRRHLSSSLRTMEVPEPTSLPSSGTNEERTDGSAIRAVSARRDTIGFHQPRGRGVTMEFEGPLRSPMKHLAKEGFSGNFADFDFGESVTKRTGSTSSRVQSPDATEKPEEQASNSSLIDQLPEPPMEPIRRPSTSSPAAAGVEGENSIGSRINPQQGFQSRFQADMSSRAPPPRPLQPLTSKPDSNYELQARETSPSSRPSSPFSRRPIEGDFSVSRGLPRGRLPEPAQTPPAPAPNDTEGESSLSAWSDLDMTSPRRPAIPPPLAMPTAHTGHEEVAVASALPSAAPPRIPSPTFPSLAEFISTTTSTFGNSFEINFDEELHVAALGGDGLMSRQPSTTAAAGVASRSAETPKVSPQAPSITLFPCSTKEGGHAALKPSASTQITAAFI